ncbi:hypothetical protein ABPG74_011527 [Tetrahymena malaccensis]
MQVFNPIKLIKLNNFNIQQLEVKFDQENLSEQDAKLLGKVLEKLKNLKTLHFNFMSCRIISQYSFSLLLSGVIKVQSLTSLTINLDQQKLDQQEVFNLSSVLAQAKNLIYLSILMQDHNLIKQGAFQLGQALENLKNLKSLTLDLSQSKEKGSYKLGQIGDQGLSDLSKSLSLCSNIQELNLNLQNNNILRKGACNLGAAIAQFKNIIKLNLQLAQVFRFYFRKLFDHTNLIFNLIIVIHFISQNIIGDQGASDFCLELKICQRLQILKLDLMSNEINEAGIIQIGIQLGQIENLKDLNINLMLNNSKKQNLEQMCQGLQKSKSLNTIELILFKPYKTYLYEYHYVDNEIILRKALGRILQKTKYLALYNFDFKKF